jgi:flagellar biosynthesis protein FliR
VLDSFAGVPIGAFSPGGSALDSLVTAVGSGFSLAIRVSAPVTGIVLLLVLLLGVVGKTMPQINIMTIGFTLKILVGLGAVAFSLQAIRVAAGDEALAVTRSVISGMKTQAQAPEPDSTDP